MPSGPACPAYTARPQARLEGGDVGVGVVDGGQPLQAGPPQGHSISQGPVGEQLSDFGVPGPI